MGINQFKGSSKSSKKQSEERQKNQASGQPKKFHTQGITNKNPQAEKVEQDRIKKKQEDQE